MLLLDGVQGRSGRLTAAASRIESELDAKINAYCHEDSEHWRWYLDDLQKLGYSLDSWGKDIPSFCNEVWSEATVVNRRTIFSLIYHSRTSADPLFALILVQIFEATGVVFIGHAPQAAIAMAMTTVSALAAYITRKNLATLSSHTIWHRMYCPMRLMRHPNSGFGVVSTV